VGMSNPWKFFFFSFFLLFPLWAFPLSYLPSLMHFPNSAS
jgi:hypothetical protein